MFATALEPLENNTGLPGVPSKNQGGHNIIWALHRFTMAEMAIPKLNSRMHASMKAYPNDLNCGPGSTAENRARIHDYPNHRR